MGQIYEDVRDFDRALAASGYTEQEFQALNGLGVSAINEWRRNRSRMAPRWAIIQAKLLANIRELTGSKFTEFKEIAPSEYIRMKATWGKTRFDEEAWILENGESFTDAFTPAVLKNDPIWDKLTPGQKMAWLTAGYGMPKTLKEFYEKWCANGPNRTIPTR